jgi:hypothetical protein
MNTASLHCSPYNHVKYGAKDETCYSYADLKLIATEYSKLTGNKIKAKSKKELHKTLKEHLSKECTTEYCWMKRINSVQAEERLKETFRPVKPVEWYKNKRTWLNTYDILYVMEQYEKLYKEFKFLGVYPIDFTQKIDLNRCIGDMMCDFDIHKNLLPDHNSFGMILNLDKHNEPGSHWVAIYCNLNPKVENYGIYYYDSVATRPDKDVLDFMKKIKSQAGTNFQLESNKIQKQFQNTECGMFSVIFLTQCLKKIPFNYICKHMRTDDEINRIRDIIYTPLS